MTHYQDSDDTKVYPNLLKIKIGESGYLNCASSKNTQWIFFDSNALPSNVITSFNRTSIEINSFSLQDAGKYTCYGFDIYLQQYFVADANIVAIGKN